MAQFSYTAIGPDGKKKSGKMEAKSKEVAVANLKAEGFTVTKIEAGGLSGLNGMFSFGAKVKKRDFAIFCRQFTSIVRAGVSIVDAFGMLSEQTQNAALKNAIQQTHSDISKGDTLAIAMRKRGGVFPPMLCNMVEAGEASGSLDIAFERMATQFEKDAKLESAVKKAMITDAEELRPPIGSVPSITADMPFLSIYLSPRTLAAPLKWSAQSPTLNSGTDATWNCALFSKFTD